MPRTRLAARKLAQKQESDRKEKVRLAEIKMETALVRIDELATRYQQEVTNQIKFIRENTDKQLLQMKWSDFMALNLKHFADHKCAVSRPVPVSRNLGVSQQPAPAPAQVQSLELSFLRWPRAGELAFSKAGSPLAVQKQQPESCAQVHIPTRKGVISVKPQKIKHVDGETLTNMDKITLKQVKVLNTNLEMIVDMATKMGKL